MSDVTSEISCAAIILAGGLGTRLNSLIPGLPKPLYPVHGRPFITFLFSQLVAAGFDSVHVSVGHMANKIVDKLGEAYGSLKIEYIQEDTPLGTGGAVFHALTSISEPNLLVMNGDSYFDIDLRDFFVRYSAKQDISASMALAYQSDPGRFGRVALTDTNRVVAFDEKSKKTGPAWINAGIYLFKASALRSMSLPPIFSLETQLLPGLAKERIEGYPRNRKFIDIGTPESYKSAANFFRDF